MTTQDSSKAHILPIILADCSTQLAWLNITKQKKWSRCYILKFWLEITQRNSSSLGYIIQLCPRVCLLSDITSTVIGPTLFTNLQVWAPAVPGHRLLSEPLESPWVDPLGCATFVMEGSWALSILLMWASLIRVLVLVIDCKNSLVAPLTLSFVRLPQKINK